MGQVRRDRLGHPEDQLLVDRRLAQLRELVRRKVEILDLQLAAFDIGLQVMHQPFVDQPRPEIIELAAKARETLAFPHHDPEHPLAEVRELEGNDMLGGDGQRGAHRDIALDHRLGGFGLAVAFAARDFQEQQLLVGEIGVDRRLGHPRLARDVIDRGALEPVAHEDRPGAFQHLVELPAAPDPVIVNGVHRTPLAGTIDHRNPARQPERSLGQLAGARGDRRFAALGRGGHRVRRKVQRRQENGQRVGCDRGGKGKADPKRKLPVLNFGGQAAELWCEGGEQRFVTQLIRESVQVGRQVLWFSVLVSKASNLPAIQTALKKAGVRESQVVDMSQGNKQSRFVAWTFHDKEQQQLWREKNWK